MGDPQYNVVFTFVNLNSANNFLKEMEVQGYEGVVVDIDTGEGVELDD